MTLATPFVWTNDNTPANSINSTGLYQAGSAPTTDVVRATNQGIQGTATVTISSVTPPAPPPPNHPSVLTTIRISPQSATVGVNLQVQFSAIGYDQYGSSMTLSTPFVWSNTNNPPNSIDQTGLYQAGGNTGTDTVTATNQGIQGTASVTITATPPVNPPPPALRHLVVSPSHATMNMGDTLPFTAVSVDDLGNSIPVTPTWSVSSADGSISTLGVMTALNPAQNVTITANLANNTPGTATVDILAPGAMTDISNAYAYPVPWKSNMGKPITFTNLASGAHIRVFTTNAQKVLDLYSSLGEPVNWNVTNMSGERLASGVYYYIIDDSATSQTKKGKLVIIQ